MRKRFICALAASVLALTARYGPAQDNDSIALPPVPQSVEVGTDIMNAVPLLPPCGSDNFWSRYPGGFLWEGYCDEHLRCHGSSHNQRRCGSAQPCGSASFHRPPARCQNGCEGDCAGGCASGRGKHGGRSGRLGSGEPAQRCVPLRGCALCGISDLFHGLFHRRDADPHVTTCARPEVNASPSGSPATSLSPIEVEGGSPYGDSEPELPLNVIPQPTTRIQ